MNATTEVSLQFALEGLVDDGGPVGTEITAYKTSKIAKYWKHLSGSERLPA